MKKITLKDSKKLVGYTASVGAFLIGNNAQAQIAHQVLSPAPVVLLNNPISIDVNGDQVPDFAFLINTEQITVSDYVINTITSALFVGAMQPSQAGAGAVGSSYYADTLNCGTSISSASSIGSEVLASSVSQYNVYNYTSNIIETSGEFLGQDNKYLGVKLILSGSGSTHYGWMKISVSNTAHSVTIHEIAINQTTNASIDACQTTTGGNVGIDQVSLEDKITIISKLNEVNINVTPDLIGGTVDLVSLSGQIVRSFTLSDVNNSFQFEGVNEGIYTLSAKLNGGVVNKRIYVK
jgi:hypothetical protein